MPRIRKIQKHPTKIKRNYFLVDACFLAEKYLSVGTAPEADAANRIRECKKWWKEIDRQVDDERARVYVPDICVAEAFKVLAKKYYQEGAFKNSTTFKLARDRLRGDIITPANVLKSQQRHIRYHDVSASRDIIIAVDRFYEAFMKAKKNVGIVDLILVATAKYLMDFHDAQRSQLHIITMDNALWSGTKKITELPNAYDPTQPADSFEKVFK
jgi:hypothetical protein